MKFSQLLLIITISMLFNTAHSSTYKPKMVKFVPTKMVIVKSKHSIVNSKEHKSKIKPKSIMTGIASFYGPGFHGKKTSSGEIFNQNALTAAHRTININSYVNVTNLKNHKSVVVRITDRGPWCKNRILDLSKAAAKRIGIDGISKVSLDIVGKKS